MGYRGPENVINMDTGPVLPDSNTAIVDSGISMPSADELSVAMQPTPLAATEVNGLGMVNARPEYTIGDFDGMPRAENTIGMNAPAMLPDTSPMTVQAGIPDSGMSMPSVDEVADALKPDPSQGGGLSAIETVQDTNTGGFDGMPSPENVIGMGTPHEQADAPPMIGPKLSEMGSVPSAPALSSASPLARDTDRDGVPDVVDRDDDNDGIPDARDPAPTTPAMIGPKLSEMGSVPSAPALGSAPSGLRDTDGDGIPNVVDRDDDNDGIPDARDPAPTMIGPKLSEMGSVPSAPALGSAPGLTKDTDRDGIPNAIDRDDDNDGIPDARDPAPTMIGPKLSEMGSVPSVPALGSAPGLTKTPTVTAFPTP